MKKTSRSNKQTFTRYIYLVGIRFVDPANLGKQVTAEVHCDRHPSTPTDKQELIKAVAAAVVPMPSPLPQLIGAQHIRDEQVEFRVSEGVVSAEEAEALGLNRSSRP